MERWGDREALVARHQDIRWSYRELNAQVDAVTAALLGLGLNAGDRIGIWSHNNSQRLISRLATAKAGPKFCQPGHLQSERLPSYNRSKTSVGRRRGDIQMDR